MRPPIPLLLALLAATDLAGQDTPLTPGVAIEAAIVAADTIGYVFEAGSEYFVRGRVDQISVDIVVRVIRPDGRVLRTFDSPTGAQGPERFQFETDMEGAYRIEIIPFEDGEGEYVITLDRMEPVASDPEGLADQLLSAYDGDDSPGVVVSVFRDGETLFSRAYGMANLTYGIPFEVETRSNIGSTSKQFTAFAVMLLAERGELSLDDDVREHIPELPDFDEMVTVRHLLTHTSGYREFLNLMILTGRRLDHGDFIDRKEIIEIVQRQPELQNSPGSEWNYNNTGYGLLAVIVERISGQTFPEFMEENVFGPLGMTRTLVRPSPEHIVEGKAEGYTPAPGGYLVIGDLGGALGAGGIYSTVGDLQKWVENFASAEVGSSEIFDQMMTPFVLTNGDSTGYGFGLFIDEQGGLTRIQHAGADVAHRSQLAYYPQINAGITTQSNHAGFDGSITFRLAEAFFGADMESDEAGDTIEAVAFDVENYDSESFDVYAGRYSLDVAPTFVLTFFREGDTLFTQATGQPRAEIVPTSDSTFSLLVVDASVTFHRNDDGEVDALTLHQGGDNRATRLHDELWEATAEELSGYAGRYFSEEIETFYDVIVEDEKLVLKQRRMDDKTLTPGAVDMFTAGGTEVTFERDSENRVIGLSVSNGRTRGVKFHRVD